MDTKTCMKAQKKAKESSTAGMKSIFSFWGRPKPKASPVASTSATPATIPAQGISEDTVSLPQDNPQPASSPCAQQQALPDTPPTVNPPNREYDPDGGLTYAAALDALRFLSVKLAGTTVVHPNDFLSIFDAAPEDFDPDPTESADDIWEQRLNSDLHKAFGPWGDELKQEDVIGMSVERVERFVRFVEYFVKRGIDASLFKERARRLVKGLEKWCVPTAR